MVRLGTVSIAERRSNFGQCDIKDYWRDTSRYEATLGARAFLVENYLLSELNGRALFDFSEPNFDVIPVLPNK
jgi:hypothetical protein